MIIRTPLIAIALAASASTAALAQEAATVRATASQEDGAKAEAEAEADKVKCRTMPVVNSRIPERICRTNAEWAQFEAENRRAMEHSRRTVGGSGDNR